MPLDAKGFRNHLTPSHLEDLIFRILEDTSNLNEGNFLQRNFVFYDRDLMDTLSNDQFDRLFQFVIQNPMHPASRFLARDFITKNFYMRRLKPNHLASLLFSQLKSEETQESAASAYLENDIVMSILTPKEFNFAVSIISRMDKIPSYLVTSLRKHCADLVSGEMWGVLLYKLVRKVDVEAINILNQPNIMFRIPIAQKMVIYWEILRNLKKVPKITLVPSAFGAVVEHRSYLAYLNPIKVLGMYLELAHQKFSTKISSLVDSDTATRETTKLSNGYYKLASQKLVNGVSMYHYESAMEDDEDAFRIKFKKVDYIADDGRKRFKFIPIERVKKSPLPLPNSRSAVNRIQNLQRNPKLLRF
jgi:hypothetical protein